MPFRYDSATGTLRRWSSKPRDCTRRTQRRMPRQSKLVETRSVTRDWPREKVGSKMEAQRRDICAKVSVEKNSVRKEYSAQMLSIRARLKERKGVSMEWVDLSSSAAKELMAAELEGFRMSARRPTLKASWVGGRPGDLAS